MISRPLCYQNLFWQYGTLIEFMKLYDNGTDWAYLIRLVLEDELLHEDYELYES